jgi:hypothetical protein
VLPKEKAATKAAPAEREDPVGYDQYSTNAPDNATLRAARITAAIKEAWAAVTELVCEPISIYSWWSGERTQVHFASIRSLERLPGKLYVRRQEDQPRFPYRFYKMLNGIEFFAIASEGDEEGQYYLREAVSDDES